MKLKTTKIGDTLHIHDDAAKAFVDSHIVPNGHGAVRSDGTSEWIIDEVVHVPGKSGTECFIWDRSGNRVKYERVRYNKAADGTITRRVERTVFKGLE